MKLEKAVLTGALLFALSVPAQLVFAESVGTATKAQQVAVPKEEYELRVLEEQIQVLRNKLYMHPEKMDQKAAAEWHKRYNVLRATLNSWNDSIDGIH